MLDPAKLCVFQRPLDGIVVGDGREWRRVVKVRMAIEERLYCGRGGCGEARLVYVSVCVFRFVLPGMMCRRTPFAFYHHRSLHRNLPKSQHLPSTLAKITDLPIEACQHHRSPIDTCQNHRSFYRHLPKSQISPSKPATITDLMRRVGGEGIETIVIYIYIYIYLFYFHENKENNENTENNENA